MRKHPSDQTLWKFRRSFVMSVSGSDAILMHVGRVGVTWWWSKFMKSVILLSVLAHGRNNSGWQKGVDWRFIRVCDMFAWRAKPVLETAAAAVTTSDIAPALAPAPSYIWRILRL